MCCCHGDFFVAIGVGFGEGDRATREERDEREAYRRGPTECKIPPPPPPPLESFEWPLVVFFLLQLVTRRQQQGLVPTSTPSL